MALSAHNNLQSETYHLQSKTFVGVKCCCRHLNNHLCFLYPACFGTVWSIIWLTRRKLHCLQLPSNSTYALCVIWHLNQQLFGLLLQRPTTSFLASLISLKSIRQRSCFSKKDIVFHYLNTLCQITKENIGTLKMCYAIYSPASCSSLSHYWLSGTHQGKRWSPNIWLQV